MASIDALAHDALSFPPGPTRGDAWMVCADAWLSRLHRRADGEAALQRVTSDPEADLLLRRQAASELVNALLDDGAIDDARTVSLTMSDLLDARMTKRIAVTARRRSLHRASLADLVVFALLATVALTRAATRGHLGAVGSALRRSTGFVIGFATYVAITGVSSRRPTRQAMESPSSCSERSYARSPPSRAPGAPLAHTDRPPRRAEARAAMGVSGAVAAAAFLVLEAVNVQYLEGFKL